MTKIGIISDTHDNISAIEGAIEIFNSKRVELVVHAGDWNSPFALARFSRSKAKVIGVFGNIDGDREALMKKAMEVGIELKGDLAEVDLNGIKVAILHGKDERIVKALAKGGDYEVIFCGHSHKPSVEQVGSTLIINPGEACGYLTGEKTVGIFDTFTLRVDFVKVP